MFPHYLPERRNHLEILESLFEKCGSDATVTQVTSVFILDLITDDGESGERAVVSKHSASVVRTHKRVLLALNASAQGRQRGTIQLSVIHCKSYQLLSTGKH